MPIPARLISCIYKVEPSDRAQLLYSKVPEVADQPGKPSVFESPVISDVDWTGAIQIDRPNDLCQYMTFLGWQECSHCTQELLDESETTITAKLFSMTPDPVFKKRPEPRKRQMSSGQGEDEEEEGYDLDEPMPPSSWAEASEST